MIGKAQRLRKKLINDMTPFVRYIIENTEHHSIPANWREGAREGEPYWCTGADGETDNTPSIAEMNSIVESYLKRQRAWEQVTVILPREVVDAMRFFGDIEKRATVFINAPPDGQSHSIIMRTTRESEQYHLGCLTLAEDIRVRARACRLKCGEVWNNIVNELQDERVREVTTCSGDTGDARGELKINAELPFLKLTQVPSEELLWDHIPVEEVLQEAR
jgi:hypothetical protein